MSGSTIRHGNPRGTARKRDVGPFYLRCLLLTPLQLIILLFLSPPPPTPPKPLPLLLLLLPILLPPGGESHMPPLDSPGPLTSDSTKNNICGCGDPRFAHRPLSSYLSGLNPMISCATNFGPRARLTRYLPLARGCGRSRVPVLGRSARGHKFSVRTRAR